MKKEKFTEWRMVDHITTPERVFAYLEAAIEENDPVFLEKVLGYILRSKGFAELKALAKQRTQTKPKATAAKKSVKKTLAKKTAKKKLSVPRPKRTTKASPARKIAA